MRYDEIVDNKESEINMTMIYTDKYGQEVLQNEKGFKVYFDTHSAAITFLNRKNITLDDFNKVRNINGLQKLIEKCSNKQLNNIYN